MFFSQDKISSPHILGPTVLGRASATPPLSPFRVPNLNYETSEMGLTFDTEKKS